MEFPGISYQDVPDDLYNYNVHYTEREGGYGEVYQEDGGAEYIEGQDGTFAIADRAECSGGEYQENHMVMTDKFNHFPISVVKFDSHEELFWTGNQNGRSTSFYHSGQDLMRYTSFKIHATDEIRDICSLDPGILFLTPTSLHMRARGGMHKFNSSLPEFSNMQCMLHLENRGQQLFVGGHQNEMIEFDIGRAQLIKTLEVGESGCVILREHPRFVCHADLSGYVYLHEPRSMKVEHSFRAHSGVLSDFDVQGNYIATCGFSNRLGQMVGDQFVMIYDMRMMKLSLPLRVHASPYLLKFMPGLASCLATVSISGLWQLLDAGQPNNAMVSMTYQLNMMAEAVVTACDVSPSTQCLIFGDSFGTTHLFSAASKTFNNFSRPTLLPNFDMRLSKSIPYDDTTTSYGSIPLELPSSPLISHWPEKFMKVPYRPTPPIDPELLSAAKWTDGVGHAPNTKNYKRNQVSSYYNNLGRGRGIRKGGGDSFSASASSKMSGVHVPIRYRKIEVKYSKMGMDDIDYDSFNRTSFSGLDMSLPNSYCNAMLQIFYYLLPFRAAMMSHICDIESCLACELGFLFHMLDKSMGQGIPCQAANFLRAFRTIPDASAMGLTFLDNETRANANLSAKIQVWNCFVLHRIHNETDKDREHNKDIRSLASRNKIDVEGLYFSFENTKKVSASGTVKSGSSPILSVFASELYNVNSCNRCHHQSTKEESSYIINLTIPDGNSGAKTFASVLEHNLCLERATQTWCEGCSKYQPFQQYKRYKSLCNVLAINCGCHSDPDIKVWRMQFEAMIAELQEGLKKLDVKTPTKKEKEVSSESPSNAVTPSKPNVRNCRYGNGCVRPDCRFAHPGRESENVNPEGLALLDQTMEYSWIPLALRIKLNEDSTVTVKDIPKEMVEAAEDNEEGIIYELMGVVSHISDPKHPDKNNLVSCIKVGPQYHKQAKVSHVSNWYLFNDISIVPITADEAVWFPLGWKTPCVLYWIRRNLPPHLASAEVENPITSDVFRDDKNLAQTVRKRMTFSPLTSDEMPTEGDIVAMDAEFVNLNQEEAEIRSDGTRTTVKPSHKSVARITCIRGNGHLQGTPFLDDYISTQEQVSDYLTQFSGIKPGDLDANFSQKHLTTLKATYVKLRYLVDQGVIFVGHGLKNDFRVINMVVPQSQVLDTVHLFHMPHNRMVSLKFLAWFFLQIKIQSVTHDSIEDARTALALYHKYIELKAAGTLVPQLHTLYDAGKRLSWKVPGEEEKE